MGAEADRIEANHQGDSPWHKWGPYLSARQWGTVREDYSATGDAWNYFPHDHARSRAYRWGEDGIAGISDIHSKVCVAIALWNGKDPILKERLYGLTNVEGNHGEDVKECYWYLQSTPTHSYMKALYKYPQSEFPYDELLTKNREAGKLNPEFELADTDAFAEDRYFDVVIEYAKATADRIYARVTVYNRGPATAELHLIPTVWFRNTWSWTPQTIRPTLKLNGDGIDVKSVDCGLVRVAFEGEPEYVFTENETNTERLFGSANKQPYVKDAFHRFLIHGETAAVNPAKTGTKSGAIYRLTIDPGQTAIVRFALLDKPDEIPSDIDAVMESRRDEAQDYYRSIASDLPPDVGRVAQQAIAGLLWNKQSYHYDVDLWLRGDILEPPPPSGRTRNEDWRHVHAADAISMPDTWEYPWFAAWDLAFHMIPYALVDPVFAKHQLLLLLRDWYMHPNGQIPAYEWAFGDVNPPVHAWAVWRVYTIDRRVRGKGDVDFLKRAFNRMLLYFTWWVNRKDAEGNNVFQGGFLGLDNIGVFDRNSILDSGSYLEQSDGTAWMGLFCLNMLEISLELARHESAYSDIAIKFFEHFLYIAHAMNNRDGAGLWDEDDGFYLDVLHHADGSRQRLPIRSIVGLIPLFAVTVLEGSTINGSPEFKQRMDWFLKNRPDLTGNVACMETLGQADRHLLSIVDKSRLVRVLSRVLSPDEFLSPHGVRSLSRWHLDHPFTMTVNGRTQVLDYEPGESTSESFGGNSNWRGPVWMPINYLLIETLQKLAYYYGDSVKVNLPAPDGDPATLDQVAADLEARLLRLFLPGADGRRPCNGGRDLYDFDPYWKNLVWFSEYFHGETGQGLGASHQTGWTALIVKIIEQLYVTMPTGPAPDMSKPARKAQRKNKAQAALSVSSKKS